MMESMIMAQQEQDEYIKQLASKVNVLTTHKTILETQIGQQASFSSTPPDRLPSKLESNPREHYNCITLIEGVKDSVDPENTSIEEGREIKMVESKEKNDGGKAMEFVENESLEIPTCF